ncbi:hypothetical protein [Helicobacter rodentium]|uniref:hypothetical protein n=2 Tax=Helicobacter rodentium TaxID=59617 RepID=UPI0026269AE6|nr:hypothetical protein [Helicobacter rodentium]
MLRKLCNGIFKEVQYYRLPRDSNESLAMTESKTLCLWHCIFALKRTSCLRYDSTSGISQ